MLVQILKPVAGIGFGYAPGHTVDLPPDKARQWIRGGIAAPAEQSPAAAEGAAETAAIEPPETATKAKPSKRR